MSTIKEQDCVFISFPSTHHAVKAQSVAKKLNIRFRMRPLPRALSSECAAGMAIDKKDIETIRSSLLENGVSSKFHGQSR